MQCFGGHKCYTDRLAEFSSNKWNDQKRRTFRSLSRRTQLEHVECSYRRLKDYRKSSEHMETDPCALFDFAAQRKPRVISFSESIAALKRDLPLLANFTDEAFVEFNTLPANQKVTP